MPNYCNCRTTTAKKSSHARQEAKEFFYVKSTDKPPHFLLFNTIVCNQILPRLTVNDTMMKPTNFLLSTVTFLSAIVASQAGAGFDYDSSTLECSGDLSLTALTIDCTTAGSSADACTQGSVLDVDATLEAASDFGDEPLELKACLFEIFGTWIGCKRVIKKKDDLDICDLPGVTVTPPEDIACGDAASGITLAYEETLDSGVWDKIPQVGSLNGKSIYLVASVGNSQCSVTLKYNHNVTMTWSAIGAAALLAAGGAYWRKRRLQARSSEPLIRTEEAKADFVEMGSVRQNSAVV